MNGAALNQLAGLANAYPRARPRWLPDEAATHWPDGSPVTLPDVIEAKLKASIGNDSAFWLQDLPERSDADREAERRHYLGIMQTQAQALAQVRLLGAPNLADLMNAAPGSIMRYTPYQQRSGLFGGLGGLF